MSISELIEILQKMRLLYGEAAVEVRNPAGDFDTANVVDAAHYQPNPVAVPRYTVFIDV